MLVGMGRKGSPCVLLAGMNISAVAVENRTAVFKKLTIEPPHDPAIPLLGASPKEMETES